MTNSDTGVLRWILRNRLEHLFYRTPPGDCFGKYDFDVM